MAFRAGILKSHRFNPLLGRQPGSILRGGEEIYLFRDLIAAGHTGLWLPPARVEHVITRSRQTLRYIYDHALGNRLLDELMDHQGDIDALLSSVTSDDVDKYYQPPKIDNETSDKQNETEIRSLLRRAKIDARKIAKHLAPTGFRFTPEKPDKRVLAIGLDGFVPHIAETMMSEGELPNMQRLRNESARFELDHGNAMYSGLAWEHFSVGRTPDAYNRHSAVYLNVNTYQATQYGTQDNTFVQGLSGHTVIFDVPYFDILGSTQVSGMTNWGSHDPGVARLSKPASLVQEITDRFGNYPAHRWIYGFTWPSLEHTREMANTLVESVNKRTKIIPALRHQNHCLFEQ